MGKKRNDNEDDKSWYGDPQSTSTKTDCEGTIVNSPYNKDRVKYDKAKSLGIHRSPYADFTFVKIGQRQVIKERHHANPSCQIIIT